MIVCHCMNISDTDIHSAIDWMRTSDPHSLITPGRIYHALGKSADCGGCMPLFLSTMRGNPKLEVPLELRNLGRRPTRAEDSKGIDRCRAIQRSSNTSTGR